ncbi:hypothetical protein FS837_011086 [Tulasnella sp. UAMH 9824]|nr:hypothetical protein FS837_011086 [Tulasnella sp. UAMH 9824]
MTSDSTLKLSGFLGVAFELPPGDMSDEDKRAIIEDLACYTEPRYRAPEVLYPTSRLGITTKSDIWALGVLLFVASFGRSPFHLSDPMDIVNVKYSFPRLEYTYIMEIIGTLLQKSPKSRPDIFEVIATIKSMLEEFQTLDDFDHSTRDLQAVVGGKTSPFKVPRRSYMSHDFKKTRRTGIPKAPPANFLLLPFADEDDQGISIADTGQNDSAENAPERDISESEEGEMAEPRPLSPNPLQVGNAVGLYLGDSPSEGPLPSVESPSDHHLRSNTLKREDEIAATPPSSPTRSETMSALEDPGPKGRSVLFNLDEEPNRVQSTPPSPIHPSPPRRGLTNTPVSEKASLVEARAPPAHEHHVVVKPPRSGAGSPPSPDDDQETILGTQSFLKELPLQGDPEDDIFNELEGSSGYSTPGNRREKEDGQGNTDSDHELFHTPPESFDPPSQNSSSPLGDIGSFIVYISEDPVRINGHFCDVFEGLHSKAGKVALKRPRIGGTGDEEEVIKRFEREAKAWRSLHHPHILEFLGTFKRRRHLYLVSPFIDNGTLVEYIAVHPEVNRPDAPQLSETADALNYLHQNGVVHGDIKGTNILVDDNVRCLLCDFGLTKMTTSSTAASMKGVGTFRWQSPELWLGSPKSFSSDTYAFAITIAEVLAGGAPFAYLENDPAVMLAVLNRDERPLKEPPESPLGVSYKNTWEVAEACWSKIPEQRISMAVAFERLRADPSLS